MTPQMSGWLMISFVITGLILMGVIYTYFEYNK
jgi:hypothetical protein